MIRHHYRDEEPDVDEIERDYWTFENGLAGATCPRCGHSDHRGSDCPNCPPETGLQRRTKEEQLAAVSAARLST